MKYLFLPLLITIGALTAKAQPTNISNNKPKGSIGTSDSIPSNPKQFKKSASASLLIKSKKNDLGLYIDPVLWQLEKKPKEQDVEYDITLKDTSVVYAYFSPIKHKNILLSDFIQQAYTPQHLEADSLVMAAKEYRMVNGLKVLYIKLIGNGKLMPIVSIGYFYSDPTSTICLMCVALNKDSYKRNEEKMHAFLNGLVKVR